MLTKRQKQILDFIEGYTERHRFAPSLEEIKKRLRLRSVSNIHQHIEALRNKGYLDKQRNQRRGIEISRPEKLIRIPILGTIAAGEPIEAIQEKEMIAVPKNKLPCSSGIYALRVVGNSMIDENINDGDVVLVRQQKTAENGQKVVALIDNYAATLKKFYREGRHIRLQPANKSMEPLIFRNGRDVAIQGIVLDVIRDNGFALPTEIYPDAKLLNRERKVKNRDAKERMRGGTKFRKSAIAVAPTDGIEKFTNKILCGDSEEILRKIPTDSIDIIITSPPYNFGLEYKDDKKNDAVHWDDYFKKIDTIWKECVRVLKPGGRLCLNVQPLFSDYIPTHHLMSKQLLNYGLIWKGEILWEKNNYNCKYTAWGSWKSPSMPYLKYTWEFVEVFSKDTHKKVGDSSKADITGDEFKKWVYAKWSIAPERNMKEYDHPAMFPKELATRLMKLFSYQDDIVLDPFNGAGTTTLCAAETGRKYIGIDISPKYCKISEKRIKEIQAKLF
ncbi:MAG: methylase N-4/N-6 domain protein [Parcubacteria group bacterium GW2011_GWA2_47_9]|nr:MAG: methylase N-4/N-6 domain protein [Parcubacteria group bacterium GW2011_GWA2_47_9]